MAQNSPPEQTDSTRLHAELRRYDSGIFSPLSGGTTPVASTPQPIREEEERGMTTPANAGPSLVNGSSDVRSDVYMCLCVGDWLRA